MQSQHRRIRPPSQDKIERDVKRFDKAASTLLSTVSSIEASRGTIDEKGYLVNELSAYFEAVVNARNFVRSTLR